MVGEDRKRAESSEGSMPCFVVVVNRTVRGEEDAMGEGKTREVRKARGGFERRQCYVIYK